MTRFCAGCPNRWQARLARALGETELADEIEAAGCPWWVQLAARDSGVVVREECGAMMSHSFMSDATHTIQAAVDEVHALRNDDHETRKEVDRLVTAAGGTRVMVALAVAGLQRYLHEQPEADEPDRLPS